MTPYPIIPKFLSNHYAFLLILKSVCFIKRCLNSCLTFVCAAEKWIGGGNGPRLGSSTFGLPEYTALTSGLPPTSVQQLVSGQPARNSFYFRPIIIHFPRRKVNVFLIPTKWTLCSFRPTHICEGFHIPLQHSLDIRSAIAFIFGPPSLSLHFQKTKFKAITSGHGVSAVTSGHPVLRALTSG